MNTGARRIAMLFAASALGSSYISGYEWLRSFAYFGSWGTIGLVLTSILLTWFGYSVMHYCHRHGIHSLHHFIAHLIGDKAGPSLSFIVYVIMLSYAGVMIYQLGRQTAVGNKTLFLAVVLIPCIIAFWLIRKGLERISQFAMIMLLLGFILIGVIFTDQRHITIPTLAYQFNSLWLLYGLFYLALHCLLVLPILIPLATQFTHARSISVGIITGGFIYTVLAGLGHVILLAYWHEVHSSNIPLKQIWDHLLPSGTIIYSLVSLGHLIISLGCWFFGLTVPLAEHFSLRQTALLILLLGSALLLSFFPFVGNFYGSIISVAATYTGLTLLLLFLWKQRS